MLARPALPSRNVTPEQQQLFDAARTAQLRAYAPYSRFRVGAAVRTSTGQVYAGCNVENAAYPQGWCAEASALAVMVSAGEREVAEVLVIADGDQLSTCCGGCRQKLREFAPLDTLVHCCGEEGIRRTFTLAELLPESFGPEHLPT
jgi:cytidine deaminase